MLKAAFPFLLSVGLAAGCASARTGPPVAEPPSTADAKRAVAQTSGDRLTPDVQALRDVSRPAKPALASALIAERWSPDLAAAVERHALLPTAENKVYLAQAYWRHGIADSALEYFNGAAQLDASEGAAWEGLARIWRDWGLPGLALGNAYRAAYSSPNSPTARNTLGTVLLALGEGREARHQFSRALELDPRAAYAQNNLCYSWVLEGDADRATIECKDALASDPALSSARNNLALARALAGDLDGAAAIFKAVNGEGAGQYNLGIALLAQRRYSAAADAFDRSAACQPTVTLASARARQARRYKAELPEKGESRERR